MYKIGTLNKISPKGLSHFDDRYTISDDLAQASGIVVRSYNMHDMEFHPELMAIARAGAGVNNIPLERCAESGIVVFNTPGANANSVCELVISSMIMAARNMWPAMVWTSQLTGDITPQVEKGKAMFAGFEVKGKTIVILGMGAIGTLVANRCVDLGMNVIGFDPFISVQGALNLDNRVTLTDNVVQALKTADIVSIHIPYMPATDSMMNQDFFNALKEGAIVLNFSRDKLADADALRSWLQSDKSRYYVTDFPEEDLLKNPKVMSVPHLGASTEEAEDNCAIMAAKQLMDYIENGNITNSVNFPSINLGPLEDSNRIAVFTKNEPHPEKLALAMFADKRIINSAGGTMGPYGYALLSTIDMVTSVPKVDGAIKVRIIQDL